MSLYQIRARQGPHIKTYLISWQLFGPKISLEIHCWPITTFFKTVGENFSQCQIVLFCMMVSNCPRCQILRGVKLSHHPNDLPLPPIGASWFTILTPNRQCPKGGKWPKFGYPPAPISPFRSMLESKHSFSLGPFPKLNKS